MYNTNERDKMAKEYDHTDHMVVMSELLVLYKLKNETQSKIDVAEKTNERMKELQKKKEDNDDEIPF
mgnify:CR=1 FL=1|jgi:hypothetical protein|tara:strand:- start:278 stop:478 length:201 start_codon:yes stop_codon:yes gene_type:complete